MLCAGFRASRFLESCANRADLRTHGTLFFHVLRILQLKHPTFCESLENVPAFLRHDDGRTLHTVVKCLELAGYDVEYAYSTAAFMDAPRKDDACC